MNYDNNETEVQKIRKKIKSVLIEMSKDEKPIDVFLESSLKDILNCRDSEIKSKIIEELKKNKLERDMMIRDISQKYEYKIWTFQSTLEGLE